MKVCAKCNQEIHTLDHENLCPECVKRARTNTKRRQAAQTRRDVLKSLGLVRVRGALGGVYWE